MKIEQRLKEALQSKSHLFTIGQNNYQLNFIKNEDGSIKNVGFGTNSQLPKKSIPLPPCSHCGRKLCDCISQFKLNKKEG